MSIYLEHLNQDLKSIRRRFQVSLPVWCRSQMLCQGFLFVIVIAVNYCEPWLIYTTNFTSLDILKISLIYVVYFELKF